MDQFDGGQSFHMSTRTDSGAWSDITTQRPLISVTIDQFSDGAGGGGNYGFAS